MKPLGPELTCWVVQQNWQPLPKTG
jgi:hypothetical protein